MVLLLSFAPPFLGILACSYPAITLIHDLHGSSIYGKITVKNRFEV